MRHESVPTLTLDQAYQAAYLWLFHVEEPPTEISERGPQSVELRSEGVAAFVRIPDRPLNQRTVLAVLATEPDNRSRLLFLTVKKLNLKTSRAYHIKLNFQELFKQPVENAETYLKKWYFWATHSRLEPIKEAAYTIKRHWNGVLQWFHSGVNNGILEIGRAHV